MRRGSGAYSRDHAREHDGVTVPKGRARDVGRGSRIRTCDLKYPKLPRYQTALYPAWRHCPCPHRAFAITRPCREQVCPLYHGSFRLFHGRARPRQHWPCTVKPDAVFYYLLKRGWRTLSPIFTPILAIVPALTSRTPKAGALEGMIFSDRGSAFSASPTTLPVRAMKIMSSGK